MTARFVGGFGFATYEAFVEKQEVLGSIAGFFALSFYIANIFNAVNAAQSFNENRELEFYYRLLAKTDSPTFHIFLIPEEKGSTISLSFEIKY